MHQPVVKPKAYLKSRHKRVRDALKALKLDGLMLTHPPDLAYLSNFTGDDSVGLLTSKDLHLITDFRYTEQAAIEAAWLKVISREGKIVKMTDALAKTFKDVGVKRVGFEVNYTTVGQYDGLKDALAKIKYDCELIPLQDVMLNHRKVKDDHEIKLIRKAADVAEEALTSVRESMKPGETEGYLAGLLIMEMKARGASDPSFPPIVATGPNSSLPHYRPGETTILDDTFLLFDWGAKVDGYCSDLTRTFALGRVPAKLKKIHGIVLDAQLAAIDFLRPGVSTRDADQVARNVIAKAGFDKYFGHGLGHGIGRDVHEMPFMRKTGEGEELRPGMIVTVEPGIYLPGEGGVRIEDDVLITHSGCEVLSSLPKTFEDCHIE
jgi:Xaa-Pro aminopeptidase